MGADSRRQTNTYDAEWVNLIRVAKQLGLTPEEIRNYIHKSENN